jgi:uncharacterized protein YbjT (DUF2867 family)
VSISSAFVLVSGATGNQGGAVARALLSTGTPVRALVRDPADDRAVALREFGAELVRGDLDDPASLKAVVDGARGVFSVQTPDLSNPTGDSEVRRGRNLVDAARAAGVEQFIQSSVAGTGNVDLDHFDEERWGAFTGYYYRCKAENERLARTAGFARWMILRPATFMENFVRPSVYYTDMTSDQLQVAVDPDIQLPFAAVNDIGGAVAAAFGDPDRFHEVELELAGDVLSFREVAAHLSKALETRIELPADPEAIRAEGSLAPFFQGQRFMSAHPAPARPEVARDLGIRTTTFQEWVSATLAGSTTD